MLVFRPPCRQHTKPPSLDVRHEVERQLQPEWVGMSSPARSRLQLRLPSSPANLQRFGTTEQAVYLALVATQCVPHRAHVRDGDVSLVLETIKGPFQQLLVGVQQARLRWSVGGWGRCCKAPAAPCRAASGRSDRGPATIFRRQLHLAKQRADAGHDRPEVRRSTDHCIVLDGGPSRRQLDGRQRGQGLSLMV